MNSTDLNIIASQLPNGGKARLAVTLNCDPAKITKAFNGLVRNQEFMTKLIAEAKKILAEHCPA